MFVLSIIVFSHTSEANSYTGNFVMPRLCSGGPNQQGTCPQGQLCNAARNGLCKKALEPGKAQQPEKKVKYGLNSMSPFTADDLFRSGDREELLIGTQLNSSNAFGNTLQDNQVDGLLDTTLKINNNNYRFHEEILLSSGFYNGSTVETGLTFDRSEEWKERAFVQIPANSFGYRFKFDEPLRSGEYLSDAYYTNPIILPFLGKFLKIKRTDADSINTNLVEKQVLNAGNGAVVYINGIRTVVTLRGTSGSHADIQMQVSGRNPIQRLTIDQRTEKTFVFPSINITVWVENIIDQDGTRNDQVTLYIGTDKTQIYHSGDPFIGEDSLDPIYTWNLKNLNTPNPTMEVKNAVSINNWDETENPLVKHALYPGDYLCLPNNYACLIFEKINQEDKDFQKYTIKTDVVRTLSDENNDRSKRQTRVIEFKAVGKRDEGLFAAGLYTDSILITVNNSGLRLYRKELGSEYLPFNSISTTRASFNLQHFDSSVLVDVAWSKLTGKGNITLMSSGNTNPSTDGSVTIYFENSTQGITYLGHSDSDRVNANDIRYNNLGTLFDISGKEENLRTKNGAIISDPKFNSKSDQFMISIPRNVNNYRAYLRVARPRDSLPITT